MKQILITEEQFKTIMKDEATSLAAEHHNGCESQAQFLFGLHNVLFAADLEMRMVKRLFNPEEVEKNEML